MGTGTSVHANGVLSALIVLTAVLFVALDIWLLSNRSHPSGP